MPDVLEQPEAATAQAAPSPTPAPLLQVDGLKTHFPVKRGLMRRHVGDVLAVDGVSFHLNERETLGLVGESGCGKSTVGRSVLRLIPTTAGSVHFDGHDVLKAGPGQMKTLRRDMQIIFQDPAGSLNPRMNVGQTIAEPMRIHKTHRGRALTDRVDWLLDKVGLKPEHATRYPHAFSGGQRQRIGIARALALEPRMIVCDEPVSALDVSVQSQVLNLMADLQDEFGLSYLFIAHNLAVVEHFCDRIAVMYLGRIVETASRDQLYDNPQHPYTRALLSAAPHPDPHATRRRIMLLGDVPSPIHLHHEDFLAQAHRMRELELAELQAGHQRPEDVVMRSDLLHRPDLKAVPGKEGHWVSCDDFDGNGDPIFQRPWAG